VEVSKLRKSAQGQDCHLRIPGVCNYNPETTVLAHIRRGNAGIGMKPPDVCGVFACSGCHDWLDGRVRQETLNDQYILDGHLRTLKFWDDNGYI